MNEGILWTWYTRQKCVCLAEYALHVYTPLVFSLNFNVCRSRSCASTLAKSVFISYTSMMR